MKGTCQLAWGGSINESIGFPCLVLAAQPQTIGNVNQVCVPVFPVYEILTSDSVMHQFLDKSASLARSGYMNYSFKPIGSNYPDSQEQLLT